VGNVLRVTGITKAMRATWGKGSRRHGMRSASVAMLYLGYSEAEERGES
jgi:hypothetical protein